jgi:N-methylhydantoinase A
MALRVGVDVGGTFTKAVAVDSRNSRLRASAVVPTTHGDDAGVTAGVAEALVTVLEELGDDRESVTYVAFSTTQAMNALLEGDVARVGVVGIGAAPELRAARRRTRVGSVKLAPGRQLHTEHEFLDATLGLADDAIENALDRLVAAGCRALAVSGAYSVDDPGPETRVAERAGVRGIPACCGHELTGTYGLETRTVSAAVNASILPAVEHTARVVERALHAAGADAPLLVLRGDGGAMATETFRRRPSFTVGSGPAAGVAAALHRLEARDAVVLECGGTSSNVSVIRHGRPVLRTIKVMGRPTSIRSIDSWVVGAAGGSMARLGRRRIAEVGPRSAHVAGLRYACFAPPDLLPDDELSLEELAPRPGDPEAYAVLRAGERRYALTATCAANALGLVPEDSHAHGCREVTAAFAPLGRRLRCAPEEAAKQLLNGVVEKVASAVQEAGAAHDLPDDAVIVAIGGAADVIASTVARRLGRELVRPEDREVLSSVGAALSLVRAEVSRTVVNGDDDRRAAIRAAERECVESGAAPATVAVETSYEPRDGTMRAVATGAISLEAGAARRGPASEPAQLEAAAQALAIRSADLTLVTSNDFYRVYSENGSGRVAVVDRLAGVPLAEDADHVLVGGAGELIPRLRRAIEDASVQLGVAAMLPRVSLVCGAHILDMSGVRRAEDIVTAAEQVLFEQGGEAVAVLAR